MVQQRDAEDKAFVLQPSAYPIQELLVLLLAGGHIQFLGLADNVC
jgi:hypothetical protein